MPAQNIGPALGQRWTDVLWWLWPQQARGIDPMVF